jgi:hypothetical protein
MVKFEDPCIFSKYKDGYSTCSGECRDYKLKLIKNKDEITKIINDGSVDGFIYDKCLDSKKKNEFKLFMKQNYSRVFTFINETRSDYELCPGNLVFSLWDKLGAGKPNWQYIVAYVKTFDTSLETNYLECCNINKSPENYDKLKQKSCSPDWCSNSKVCDIDQILLSKVCDRVMMGYDVEECASTFDQANGALQQKFVDSKTDDLVRKIGHRMYHNIGEKWNKNAGNDITIYNQTIKSMLKSGANTSKIQSKYKEVCNDETIFDGTDWEGKLKSYGKICSCFWDPNKNNGNPANLQKKKIEALHSKEGLPDELKEYAQFVSDIDPSGPTYCWDSQCVNNDENLIPNRSQCPSTNIASCLAYINFDNKGIIKGNVNNIAKCAATLKDETLNNMLTSGGGHVNASNGSGTNNGSGTKPKNKKNNTTIWIIVVVVALVIIIIVAVIALSGSASPQQAPIAYS